MTASSAFTFVLFGGTGDLAQRKILPALYRLAQDGFLAPEARIHALARAQWDRAAYIAWMQGALAQGKAAADVGSQAWRDFVQRVDFTTLDARDAAAYAALAEKLASAPRPLIHYLATSPALFADACRHLAAAGLAGEHARVVLEKPLGHDLASSREINDAVAQVFREDQIYRIDHYLGKESVQNLMALRFGNSLFEPLWRREWIANVQITIAESLGMEARGDFYDQTGALRDMVQNHLMQLLCIVAMEPPTSLDADAVRDEKLRVLRSMLPLRPEEADSIAVRGQYRAGAVAGRPVPGYLEEQGIAAGSRTETFVALRVGIDNWRWAGVPFLLRTGKRLAERMAEIVVNFRAVPQEIFPMRAGARRGNRLVIRLQPDEAINLHCLAKRAGDSMELCPVSLDLAFSECFTERRAEAYERLLLDVMRARLGLFVRRDLQEQAWRWIEPLLGAWADSPLAPKPYNAGTWGPAAASALANRFGAAWEEES